MWLGLGLGLELGLGLGSVWGDRPGEGRDGSKSCHQAPAEEGRGKKSAGEIVDLLVIFFD